MIVGLDVGGANVKASDGKARSVSFAFPLWQKKSELTELLRKIGAEFEGAKSVALTMTGELADCFESKQEGVEFIVDAVDAAFAPRSILIYSTNGSFVSTDVAKQNWRIVAAANWHAIAKWVATTKQVKSENSTAGILIDIGSTTTDVIPFAEGDVIAKGRDDLTRLCLGELVYSGVKRTPVFGLVKKVRVNGVPCPVAKEYFATANDIYLLTGDVPENSTCSDSADGRANTIACASQRLARMLCCDKSDFKEFEFQSIADQVKQTQMLDIKTAIDRVVRASNFDQFEFVLSGSGSFLASQVVGRYDSNVCVSDFAELFAGQKHSDCAAAYSVAALLQHEQSKA